MMDADTTNLITVFCAFFRQLQIFYLQLFIIASKFTRRVMLTYDVGAWDR